MQQPLLVEAPIRPAQNRRRRTIALIAAIAVATGAVFAIGFATGDAVNKSDSSHSQNNKGKAVGDYLRQAKEEDVSKWLRVDSVEVSVPQDLHNANEKAVASVRTVSISEIVTLGKLAWSVIKDGEPVENVDSSDSVSAVPSGVTSWTALAGFQNKVWGPFSWSYKNGFGATVIQYDWTFTWNYQGNYNGEGAYIGQAEVATTNVHVDWGFHLDVDVSISEPLNAGTTENPIAALEITLNMKSGTVLSSNTQQCVVQVKGDGTSKVITCAGYGPDNTPTH
eukprot:CAMPEP_0117028202 /NCGR_PEP_ID=MMETSP0472-20121206/20526_1 /TAXON_ID=693140 ORGANISM="Tiarina fusus, Strain LIS" /NCGR_SAMPLE_ID=MMETSP0472 /ASSEMBLY_ACC=CAM_ASM_000603 /LENGTH=279 /DNA_ID=CAMNT_0004735623 /DNA_START=23 /DNA_END=862 /DNA_ORIENTATION=+